MDHWIYKNCIYTHAVISYSLTFIFFSQAGTLIIPEAVSGNSDTGAGSNTVFMPLLGTGFIHSVVFKSHNIF